MPDSISFGSILDGFFNKLESTIQQATEDAKNSAIELEITTANQLLLAIENAKNAYNQELDYTIDKISKAAKNSFDQLSSMMQKFEKATQEDLQDLEVQAQQLVNSLPFANRQPQLTSIKPRYFAVSDNPLPQDSFVQFKGNYLDAAKTGFEPSFTFGDKQCPLVDHRTGSLTFQVPLSAFQTVNKTQYAFRTGVLSVPWDDGWIFSHKAESAYKVGLGALPQLAGNGSVEYVNRTTQRINKRASSPDNVVNGNSWYPNEWHTAFVSIVPEPGWTIDASKTPNLVASNIHGKHSQWIESVAPNQIVVGAKVFCGNGHDIGIVQFRVDYSAYQDQPIEKKRVESFSMNWKDSKLLIPQANETISKVVFDDYKGTHQEYAAPSLDGILQIEAEGNGVWKIWAEPPKDLQLKATDLSKALREKIKTVLNSWHLLKVKNIPKELRVINKTKPNILNVMTKA